MTGYMQYHAIPGNSNSLSAFRYQVAHLWHKVLRRQSQRHSLTWERFSPICDRGPTYRSQAYQRLLTDNKIISSYSRAGNCWDNALMECFWGHMKCELGYVDGSTKKRSFHSLAQEIADYISFYNERRIQKNLSWSSPIQYRIQKCGETESTLLST